MICLKLVNSKTDLGTVHLLLLHAGLQHTSQGWWTIIRACMCMIIQSMRLQNKPDRLRPSCVFAKSHIEYIRDSSCCQAVRAFGLSLGIIKVASVGSI